jgi:hypothetical protein
MMLKGLSLSALALAVGLVAAPRLSAQSAAKVLVCKDGSMSSTSQGTFACLKHGGIDQQASINAQRGGYGVYGNTGANGSSRNRGVYQPTTNGSERGVYNGGVVNGSNRSVYDQIGNVNGKGKAKGKHKHHKKHHDGDDDHDRDDRRGDRDNDHQSSRLPGRYDGNRRP